MLRTWIMQRPVAIVLAIVFAHPVAADEPAKDGQSETLYVVSFGKGALTTVDTATHKVLKSISLRTNVNSVAVTPDGTKAYLSFANGDRLLVVDLETGNTDAISGNIGWNSDSVLFAPKGDTLYLATSGGFPSANKILCIDPQKQKVMDEIMIGPYRFPQGITGFQLDLDGSRAFAVDATVGDLVVIDLVAKKVAQRVPLQKRHEYAGLAIAPDGKALYLGTRAGTTRGLVRLDAKTLESTQLGNIDEAMAQPILSPDGKTVYAIVRGSQIVGLEAAEGKEVSRWDLKEPLKALAISQDGQTMYVACWEWKGPNKVLALDARAGKIHHEITVDSPCALLLAAARKEDPTAAK